MQQNTISEFLESLASCLVVISIPAFAAILIVMFWKFGA